MFRGDLDLKDKKKNYILIVITILLCGSLIANYFFYQQKDAAESTIKLAKVERLSNSLSSSDIVFRKGHYALATGDNQKEMEYLNDIKRHSNAFQSAIRTIPRHQYFTNMDSLYTDFSVLNNNSIKLIKWIQTEGFSEETEDLLINMLNEYQKINNRFDDIWTSIENNEYDNIESYIHELDNHTSGKFYQYDYIDSLIDNEDEKEEAQHKLAPDERIRTEELIDKKQDVAKEIAKKHLEGQLNFDQFDKFDHRITGGSRFADDYPSHYSVEIKNGDWAQLYINKYDEVNEHKIVCGDRRAVNYSQGSENIVVDEINLNKDQAISKAKEFLAEKVGLQDDELFLDGFKKEDGKAELAFLEMWDDTIIKGGSPPMPKLSIDMTVTLDDGTIEKFKRRDILKEKVELMKEDLANKDVQIGVKEAKKQINPRNELLGDGQLVYSISELLWRFPVLVGDDIYLFIYINAETGEEQTIKHMSKGQVKINAAY